MMPLTPSCVLLSRWDYRRFDARSHLVAHVQDLGAGPGSGSGPGAASCRAPLTGCSPTVRGVTDRHAGRLTLRLRRWPRTAFPPTWCPARTQTAARRILGGASCTARSIRWPICWPRGVGDQAGSSGAASELRLSLRTDLPAQVVAGVLVGFERSAYAPRGWVIASSTQLPKIV